MAKVTNKCNTDCNKTFPELFHEALANICFLGSVSGVSPDVSDRRVAVTDSDPTSSVLIDKLIGVSGIDFDVQSGVSGEVYVASLDLEFLDDRYVNQVENVLSFELNAGAHNGHVRPARRIGDGFESLIYPNHLRPSSSWNISIPKNFFPGETSVSIKWTHLDSVSGIALFDVKYNSVGVGELISSSQGEMASGVSDGTALKVYESTIDIVSGFVEKDDTFMLKITRLGNSIVDTLDDDVDVLDVSLKFKQT